MLNVKYLSADEYEKLWQKVKASFQWDSEGFRHAAAQDFIEGTGNKYQQAYLMEPAKPAKIEMYTAEGKVIYMELPQNAE